MARASSWDRPDRRKRASWAVTSACIKPVSTPAFAIATYPRGIRRPDRQAAARPTRPRFSSARPRVPLILNYLIAFYGEQDVAAERMMGSVVGQLHASPILARDQIEKVIESNAFLAGSDLASQPESIKLTPVYLSLEDLSKLWTVFFQVAHRLSLIYQVSVVMIEANQEPEVLLKVQQVNTSASLLTPPPVPNPGAA